MFCHKLVSVNYHALAVLLRAVLVPVHQYCGVCDENRILIAKWQNILLSAWAPRLAYNKKNDI